MIEMAKKYKTRGGMSVRILATDIKDKYSVCAAVLENGESLCSFTKEGLFVEGEETNFDLIEVTPYDDFKEDDLCVVWGEEGAKRFRYFSHVENGAVNCFVLGCTSYTTVDTSIWPNCRKATEEEIKTKIIKD